MVTREGEEWTRGKGLRMTSLRERLLGVSPEYQKFLDMHLGGGEPFPGKTLVADGWRYKDLPQLTAEQFEMFLDVVGDENIEWLAISHSPKGHRGQMYVSADGQQRLQTYLERNDD